MYNVHKTDSVDTARHLLFSKSMKPETIASTSDALRFHLMRVHYQAMIWKNAHCPTPELPSPIEMGWKVGESGLEPILMTLSPVPDSCLEMVTCACRHECKTRRCKRLKSELRCTSMCACQQVINHQTPYMNTM